MIEELRSPEREENRLQKVAALSQTKEHERKSARDDGAGALRAECCGEALNTRSSGLKSTFVKPVVSSVLTIAPVAVDAKAYTP